MADMREMILAAGRLTAQAHGYNGLSFRELAKEVGVKSASIHYHFPTKADLGAALARRYWEDSKAALEELWAAFPDPVICLRKYTDAFRQTLLNENRMCMCGFMAAEYRDLPDAVKAEVQTFADVNVAWLARVLSGMDTFRDPVDAKARALAIYAAISGAQLIARSRADVSAFDKIVKTYCEAGLIPHSPT